MATVDLNVPHLPRNLLRGERIVLHDVLRVERAGDDLLAWVRQADGSIQLQRLVQFFLPGLDVVLETSSNSGDNTEPDLFTSQSQLPSTVLAVPTVAVVTAEVAPQVPDSEGDFVWLQLLTDDLAQVDAAWSLLAQRLQGEAGTLEGMYVAPEGQVALSPVSDILDPTLERPSFVPVPVEMRLQSGGLYINQKMQLKGVEFWGDHDTRLVLHLEMRGSSGSLSREYPAGSSVWPLQLSSSDVMALGEGPLVVRAWYLTVQGQRLAETQVLSLIIDTQPPINPSLDNPAAMADGAINLAEAQAGVVFRGTAEAGSMVSLKWQSGSSLSARVTTDSSGRWQYTASLAELGGRHNDDWVLEVSSMDPAGNSALAVAAQSMRIQTAPPATPTWALDDSTPTRWSETATSDTTPKFIGSGPTRGKVVWYLDRNSDGQGDVAEWLAEADVDVAGQYSLTLPVLPAGQTYPLLVVAIDRFGNASERPVAVPLQVDNTAPAAPVLSAIASDNRISYAEYQRGTEISGVGEAGSKVFLQRQQDGIKQVNEVVVGSDGRWSLTISSNDWLGFSTGTMDVLLRQIDPAGNASDWTSALHVPVRLSPLDGVGSLQLLKADDTGLSDSDGLTSRTSPTLMGLAVPHATIRLVVDANGDGAISAAEAQNVLAEVSADGSGNFSWNGWSSALMHGTELKILAVGWDGASGTWSNADPVTGLPVNLSQAATLQLRVDTTAPSAPDIGIIAGNDIVDISEIAAGVTFGGLAEPGAQVTLRWLDLNNNPLGVEPCTVTADALTGVWVAQLLEVDLNRLGAQVRLQVQALDEAGNTDLGSYATRDFIIDTSRPAAPSVIAISADTGSSSTDGRTRVSAQVLSGTALAGATVTLFNDVDGNGLVGAGESLAVVTADGVTGAFQTNSLTFADGTYQLKAVATVAGIDSVANVAKLLVIDTAATVVSLLDVAGGLPGSGLINIAKLNVGTTFGGAAENGLPVVLRFKDSNNQWLSLNGQTLVFTDSTPSSEQWQIALTPAQLTDLAQAAQGTLTAVVSQTDVAGNEGTASAFLLLDTLRPDGAQTQMIQAIALQAQGELGGGLEWGELVDGTDVQVALPNDLGAGGRLLLKWGNQSVEHQVTSTELAQGYAVVSVSASALIAAGAGNVAVKVSFIDVAGNASSVDRGVTHENAGLSSVAVSFSGRPPGFLIDESSYHRLVDGIYHSNVTQGVTLLVTGLAGEIVDIKQGGLLLTSVTLDNAGRGSVQVQLAPSSTPYALTAQTATTAPSMLNVFMDNVRPGTPSLNALADDLINAAERNQGVQISGTCDDRAEISYWLYNTVTGVVSNTATVSASGGNWSAYISLEQWFQVGDGTLRLFVTQTDWAGNVSDPIETRLMLDSSVLSPVVNTVADDDLINGDEATAGVVLRGAAEPGAQVNILLQGGAGQLSRTLTAGDSGLWSWTLDLNDWQSLGQGSIRLAVTQTDLAGNVSGSTVKSLTLDTRSEGLQIEALTGDNHLNLAERSLSQTLTGQGESGATITVQWGGLSKQVQVAGNGRWSTIFTAQELADLQVVNGSASLAVRQTDLAGNFADVQSTVTVNGAALAGTVSLTRPASSVAWAAQASTLVLDGTGPVGTQVYVHLTGSQGGVDLGPASVDTSGQWTLSLTSAQMRTDLGAGAVTVQMWAVNGLGLQSTVVASDGFVLESQIPSPTLQTVADDGIINLAEQLSGVTLQGTGVAGHTIEVSMTQGASAVTRSAQVASNGLWTLPLNAGDYSTLGQGLVSLSIVQKSGGFSSVVLVSAMTIDTVPPSPPIADSVTQSQAANAVSELNSGITATEAVDGVDVVIPLPANVVAGDRVELFWGGGSEPVVSYVVQASDVGTGTAKTLTLTVPGDEIALRGSNPNLNITYKVSDAAGNADVLRVAVSGLVVEAPPQAPQFNAVASDGYVNLQEYTQAITSPLAINGQVSGSGAVTLVLTGTLGALTLTPTVTAGTWSQALTTAQLDSLGEGVVTMSAYQVAAGVTSPTGSGSFVFDKTLPAPASAESVRAALEKNADTELAGGLLPGISNNNLTEAYDGTVLYVPLAADAVAGDSLQLYWNSLVGSGGLQVDSVLSATDVLRGYAVVTISEEIITQAGDNANLRVEAQSVDRAGNIGARYEVWTGPVDAVPKAPGLDIVSQDGMLNITDMAGTLTFSGTADAGFSVQVQLVKGTSSLVKTLTADMQGVWTWTLTGTEKSALSQFGQGVFEFRARQTDVPTLAGMPGNPSRWASANVSVDTVAPGLPVIDPITADNRIGSSEAQSASGVKVTGTGEAGASLELKFKNGSAELLTKSGITVNSEGVWELVLSGADFVGWPTNTGSTPASLTVSAQQTDRAGNPSLWKDSTFLYSDDVVQSPVILEVGASDGVNYPNALQDGFFNAAEAVSGLKIRGTGTAGHWVRVRITVGDVVTDLPLSQVDGSGGWVISLQGNALNALGQGTAAVSVVQRNGNTASADESAVVTGPAFVIDTVAPAVQASQLTVVDVTEQTLAHAKEGDVLLVKLRLSEGVTFSDSTPGTPPSIDLGLTAPSLAVYDAARSAVLGSNWLVFAYTVKAGDSALEGALGASGWTVNWNDAVVQDAAQNLLSGSAITLQSHGIRVDTAVPLAPDVANAMVPAIGESLAADVTGSAGGAVINLTELTTGKALVRVNLGSGVLANDTLEVKFSWNVSQSTTVQKTLLASEVSNGYAWVMLPAALAAQQATDLQAQARVVDVARNASAWSAATTAWSIDTLAPSAPVIATIAGDDRMNLQERTNLGVVAISGLEVGATVEAWVEGFDASTLLNVRRDVTVASGAVSALQLSSALGGLADGTWVLRVRQTDTAGNVSTTASRLVAMDTNVPGDPVLSVGAANDGWVNIAETSAGLTVTVDLRNTRTKTGDELVFRWTDASNVVREHRQVLISGQAGTELSLILPASFVSQNQSALLPQTFNLNVQIEDTGGNTSSIATLTGAQLDTYVGLPAIDATSLTTVTAVAAKSPGTFSGTGAEAGATVEVLLTSSTTGQVRRMTTVADNSGVYTFTLTPSDYKDLGGKNATSTIAVSVIQTDLAGNKSSANTASFRLDLSLAPPAFFDFTGDNLVNASEANVGQLLMGTGSPGAAVQIQFFDASAGANTSALLTLNNIAVNSSGLWQTTISSSQFNTLSGGGSRTLRAVATQVLGGNTSDPGTLQFVVDMTTPTLTSLTRFDANGDGGNNDGLLLTLSEPVKVSRMGLLSTYSAGLGESLGTGARIEAMETLSLNGSTYAQRYQIYLGNGHTLSGNEVLSLLAGNVEDLRGNTTTSNLAATVPNLSAVGRPIPPLVVALDNVISGSEAAGGFNIPFTIPATQAANSFLRFYINGVQTQVTYNGSTVLDIPLTTTQTTVNLSIPQNNWGADGSKTVSAQVVIDPGTANERTSLFSSSKIALLDTAVDGAVQSMVLVQHDGDGLLELGEKIRLTFKESVKLGAGALSAVFGTGATLSAVAPVSGYAQQWDVTLGANPALVPGQSYGMSSGVLTTGVRYIMVRNNPSPTDALSFGELIVLDANGNNIAQGKPTIASSSYNTQYDKSKVVDGDATGSETSSWGGATSGDQWVQVDLGQIYDLNAIVIVPRNNFGEGKSFTVFAGATDMSAQTYTALSANTALYQYNYSSSAGLTSPLVLGQAVIAIDAAGNITGTVSSAVPANLTAIPQVGYVDAVSTDNVLSATDMVAAAIDVRVVLKSAQTHDVVKLFMDGQEVGSRTLLASDITNGFVNVSVSRSDWGADGERRLQTSVVRGAVSSELSVARAVYVSADHAHWSQVRDASTIWFDPDNLVSQGLGTAVTNWVSSAGGATAVNTDATKRPTLIMVNGRYALNFDGVDDHLNFLDSTGVIARGYNSSLRGSDISGFVLVQPQYGASGARGALSYFGNAPSGGGSRGLKLGLAGTQLLYTNYTVADYWGPANSVSPNSSTVLTLRTFYDSASSTFRMQGYNLNVQDINASGTSATANMQGSPTGMTIGSNNNFGVNAFWLGMIGDGIWLNYKVSDAQMYEIQTYMAAKYASVGVWVTQATGGVYRLDNSAQTVPLIDQRVDFRSVVANEVVKVSGSDYVQTGRGDDTVQLKDLFFRYIDAGQGQDTLQWAVDYAGPRNVVLADFVSNMRGLSSNTTDDARVNAAGYHELAGFERLDLRQIGLQSGALETQVLTVSAVDVKQLSESNQLEVWLGNNDVLKTSGFSAVSYGNFTLNDQFYSEQHRGTTADGTQVEMYVRGGRLAPDPSGVSISGTGLQLDFNTALVGNANLIDFSVGSWGSSTSVNLSALSFLNNRQSLYMDFQSAVTTPVRVEYRGSTLKDEDDRNMGHTVWGIGTEGHDALDASSWDAFKGAVIVAGAGNDSVRGTAGNDVLVGGFGADTLTGGGGADRFVYKAITSGTGGTGGLGGTGGDVITDFNTARNSTNADVLDLSDLFEYGTGTRMTGDAQTDTRNLIAGGYMDLVRSNSGKDLQVWVDRDGGGVMGLLVTLKDLGSGTGTYFTVENESSEQLLQRLLTEGRVQVTHA